MELRILRYFFDRCKRRKHYARRRNTVHFSAGAFKTAHAAGRRAGRTAFQARPA